jgi:hypothetical protein
VRLNQTYWWTILIRTVLFCTVPSFLFGAPGLEEVFRDPPKAARPQVLWMWMGSNVNREGITRDLEALQAAGFGGTILFSAADTCTPWAGVIGNSPTPEIIAFSAPWWDLVRQAAAESRRLHLDFGMSNCPGYESSGGPWISPEKSMQQVVWAEQSVRGPSTFQGELPRPKPDLHAVQAFPLFNPTTGRVEKPEIAARREYYRDIVVLALPASGIVAADQVIDLTKRMTTDGNIAWDVPAGEWIIYRFGHTTRGKLVGPGQWEAVGLECDKMSREAVEFHLDHIIGEAQKQLGDLVGNGFDFYHFDSYEAGTPDWTPRMREEFQSRRGYDMTCYLPTFAQRVIGSEDAVKTFRSDFQQTIRDLYRENYFAVIAQKLHAAGLQFMCEPYGGPWTISEVVPSVDRVLTEYWTEGGKFLPYELAPTVAAVRSANGNLIEAEAFTGPPGFSQWSETPAWLKSIGDTAYCEGVNRLCLHRFVHQPLDERYRPGVTMGQWGTHFDRTQTWWGPGKAWVEYLTRCQAVLQWGRFVTGESDFAINDPQGDINVRAVHRRDGDTDVYFVANVNRQAGSASCTFAVNGKQPELWDPVRGTMRILDEYSIKDGKTTIPLEFDDSESVFVVFRKPLPADVTPSGGRNFPALTCVAEIPGPWAVRFDPAWGGPENAVFEKLVNWTERKETGIRYYSGTASYACKFDKPAALAGGIPVWLDLGTVHDLAQVLLNGRDLGIIWTAPCRFDITSALKPVDNSLEIRITNTWANRLIGDEQEPADCEWGRGDQGFGGPLKSFPDWVLNGTPRPSTSRYTFTTWNYFSKDSPLRPSGLLGPVTIKQQSNQ